VPIVPPVVSEPLAIIKLVPTLLPTSFSILLPMYHRLVFAVVICMPLAEAGAEPLR
jgi:hypothetical protein